MFIKRLKKRFAASKFFNESTLFILDIIFNVFVIIALVYVVRTYLVAPFQVYGPSMCNTLNYQNEICIKDYGEYIIVDKFSYITGDPQRGDIVVFHPPQDPENYYIKRVIGLPGETLKIDNGKVFVKKATESKWTELSETYLNEDNQGKTASFTHSKREYQIPEGKYFTMGDNRRASTDSRSCFTDPFGGGCKGIDSTPFITKSHIAGKAWIVLWPFSNLRILDNPAYEASPAVN